MLTGLLFGQDVITIELKNGDKISGQVVSETESQITVKTNFGDLDIPKVNIAFIEREITENINSVNQNVPIELNQEARWRTINSSMAIGNFLYGVGIPYVLGIEESQSLDGFRLLMFGGGFYASYVYTREMELPMGRWKGRTR